MFGENLGYLSFSFKNSLTKQIMVTIFLIIFLLAADLFLYFKLKALNRDLEFLRSRVEETQQLLVNFSALKLQEKEAKPILAILGKILPTKDGVLKNVARFHEAAQRNSLQQSFSFGQEYRPEAGSAASIGFNLILSGSLKFFPQYFRDLESLPPFIQFSYIEITQKDGGYQLNSSGRIYMK